MLNDTPPQRVYRPSRWSVPYWVLATALLPTPIAAQTAPAQTTPTPLPAISVEGQRPTSTENRDYKPEVPASPKLTEPLLDTPQSITVVPRQVIQDQGATTLRDTLRNVPSISLAAGEGGNQGDALTIRGFNARGDIYLDTMRDFGSYYRDPFNLEAVEALKGPASVLFGKGSTGGVVNQVSKTPQLERILGGSTAFGTDNTKRVTADLNTPIEGFGPGAAVRLNLMYNDSGVAGRDEANYARYALAPSAAFGIGTDTRLNLWFYHQAERNVPDYGLPWRIGRVAPVDRDNFYGFKDDNFLRTDIDIATARFEHDINANVTIRDQIRYAYYARDFRITEPQSPAGITPATPVNTITAVRNQIAGNSVETMLQNQFDVISRFDTGFLKHSLVTGFEFSRETSEPIRFTFTGVPGTSLLSPDKNQAFRGTSALNTRTDAEATTFAFYGLDTIKLGEHFELIGGIRYDRFAADFQQFTAGTGVTTAFDRIDNLVSYRAAAVYKPVTAASIYFSYGTSFNPSAEQIALAANTANLPPEKTETYEIGAKWDVLANLNLRTAVFHAVKTNARTPDPNNALLLVLSGEQEVNGFEVEVAGNITEKWAMFGGYAYIDSEITKSNTPTELGHPISNTPKHTFTLWTTYQLPWGIQIGGGSRFVSSRNANQTPNANDFGYLRQAPAYWVFDAMAKYQLTDNVDIQLNLYNLADKFYLDLLHPSHVVPGAGRAAILTTNFKF